MEKRPCQSLFSEQMHILLFHFGAKSEHTKSCFKLVQLVTHWQLSSMRTSPAVKCQKRCHMAQLTFRFETCVFVVHCLCYFIAYKRLLILIPSSFSLGECSGNLPSVPFSITYVTRGFNSMSMALESPKDFRYTCIRCVADKCSGLRSSQVTETSLHTSRKSIPTPI